MLPGSFVMDYPAEGGGGASLPMIILMRLLEVWVFWAAL
jgi:hypothetical protein